MADQPAIPPDTTVSLNAALWAGQIRTLLALLSGMGVIGSVWAGVTVEQISAVLILVMLFGSAAPGIWASFWSWRQKMNEATASRTITVASAIASATASAAAKKPVPLTISIVETPVGQPNLVVATLIPKAEAAIAPVVEVGAKPEPAPRPATM